ncbi:MAG: hypothetical protein ABSF71_10590 [Terriglobia bacterium]|jgi:predicted nucleic acid-binding protein
MAVPAYLLDANVTRLLTLNPRDFERFTGLTPVHPGDLQSRAT